MALSVSIIAKTPPLASIRRPRSAIVGLYQSESRLFICLNSWSKYFVSSSKGFGVRSVVTMEAKNAKHGSYRADKRRSSFKRCCKCPQFFQGFIINNYSPKVKLRAVPTIVTAHIFCACQGSRARRERNAQHAGHVDWFCLL